MEMNKYEVGGLTYEAKNEHAAVKQAHKRALHVRMIKYMGDNTWEYRAYYNAGSAYVIVKKAL